MITKSLRGKVERHESQIKWSGMSHGTHKMFIHMHEHMVWSIDFMLVPIYLSSIQSLTELKVGEPIPACLRSTSKQHQSVSEQLSIRAYVCFMYAWCVCMELYETVILVMWGCLCICLQLNQSKFMFECFYHIFSTVCCTVGIINGIPEFVAGKWSN